MCCFYPVIGASPGGVSDEQVDAEKFEAGGSATRGAIGASVRRLPLSGPPARCSHTTPSTSSSPAIASLRTVKQDSAEDAGL